MQHPERKPLFDLGQLIATPGALAALENSGQSPMDFLSRPNQVSRRLCKGPAVDRIGDDRYPRRQSQIY